MKIFLMAGNFLWQFMIFDYDFKNDINFKIITKNSWSRKKGFTFSFSKSEKLIARANSKPTFLARRSDLLLLNKGLKFSVVTLTLKSQKNVQISPKMTSELILDLKFLKIRKKYLKYENEWKNVLKSVKNVFARVIGIQSYFVTWWRLVAREHDFPPNQGSA